MYQICILPPPQTLLHTLLLMPSSKRFSESTQANQKWSDTSRANLYSTYGTKYYIKLISVADNNDKSAAVYE